MNKLIITALLGLALFVAGCKSNKEAVQDDGAANKMEQRQRGEKSMLSAEAMFAEMDKNKDGNLSMDEVKGPMKNDFNKIDLDGNLLISLEELEKAPKPNRKGPPNGDRPNRGN